jgi:hypothetical protein
MEPPDFKFPISAPAEDARSVGDHWPWAICERLDYISQALFELLGKTDAHPQNDSVQAGKQNHAKPM